MMIGAPDINQAVIASLIFIGMIGDVGGKIRPLAVFFTQHAVFAYRAMNRHSPRSLAGNPWFPCQWPQGMT